MDVPMIPNVLMLDAGENLDDQLFVRGDLLDALSVDIYFKDVKSKLLTVFDVVTTKLRNHISDTYCHTNPTEKRYWNNKVDKDVFDSAIAVLKSRIDGWEGSLEGIQSSINNLPNFNLFALKSQLSDFLTNSSLENALRYYGLLDSEGQPISDLTDYIKKGSVLGTINGTEFKQGDSIVIEGSGSTVVSNKITDFSVSGNQLTLRQENNSSSPFVVTLPSSSEAIEPATTSTLGGIKVGYTENNKNYAVKLDGNNRAYVTVPWSSGSGEGGGSGEDGGYWEIIFKATATSTVPALPINYDLNPEGWSHSAENSDGTKIVWMANRWVAGNGTKSVWQGPWRISGISGENGIDGDEYEYIYTRTLTDDSSTIQYSCNGITPASESTGRTPSEDDFVPQGWTDNPVGVDSSVRYEWVAIRKKTHTSSDPEGSWSQFDGPILWSSYGRNGTDGDGVEYIFFMDSTGNNEPQPQNTMMFPPAWTNDTNFQNREYIRSGSTWTDDPQPHTVQGSKQYVSMRKKYADIEGAEPTWHAYSTPALWSYYAKDGQDGQGGGTQYLEYPVLRLRGEWQSGVPSPAYNDGTVYEDHVMYIDVVEYDGIFWKCILHHSDSHEPGDRSAYWSPFSVYGDAAFDAVIARYLRVNSIAADQLIIYDEDSTISAGMSGADTTVGNSDIRIWAGASEDGNIADAPFTVDSDGKLKASNAEIQGRIIASEFNSAPVLIEGTNNDHFLVTKGDSETEPGIYRITDTTALSKDNRVAGFSSNIQVKCTGTNTTTNPLIVEFDISGKDDNGTEITVCDYNSDENHGRIRIMTTGIVKYSVYELLTSQGTTTIVRRPYMNGSGVKLIPGGCATFKYFFNSGNKQTPSVWYANGDLQKDS